MELDTMTAKGAVQHPEIAPKHDRGSSSSSSSDFDRLDVESGNTSSSDINHQSPFRQILHKTMAHLGGSGKRQNGTYSGPKNRNPERVRRRRLCLQRAALAVVVILVMFGVLVLIWFSFTLALLQRLNPPVIHNGLQRIVSNWKDNGSLTVLSPWPEDFSRDITPIPAHSHNDEQRHIPLYAALAVGCSSVEADIWLQNGDLFVGHAKSSLTPSRTLRSLYIDQLVRILQNQNQNQNLSSRGTEHTSINGVYEMSPNTSLTLLLDLKTDGNTTWEVVLQQLTPLRELGYLTYFNGTSVVEGPITVVGTGNTPFDLLTSNTTYRDTFFDAPLNNLTNIYTKENSYYASVSLPAAIGTIWFGKLNTKQLGIIKNQIDTARSKGLKSRYWDTPSWPISVRDRVWNDLVQNDVGMLNVDDLVSAARWNWSWCTILGFNLC